MLNKYSLVVLISTLGILSGSCNWLDCPPGAGGDYEKTTGPQEFLLLTYNVAGLPEGISSSHPRTNIPQISPMLNEFGIVLVQEDFSYHDLLVSEAADQLGDVEKGAGGLHRVVVREDVDLAGLFDDEDAVRAITGVGQEQRPRERQVGEGTRRGHRAGLGPAHRELVLGAGWSGLWCGEGWCRGSDQGRED